MHPNLPTFRADDLSAASGIPASGVEMLVKVKLAPPSEARGRGAARVYTSQGVAQMAVIGALFSAGLELTPAARLAGALTEEMHAHYLHIPDRLNDFAVKLDTESPGLFHGVPLGADERMDRFALYSIIRTQLGLMELGGALKMDMFVEIIDRRFVFFGHYESPAYLSTFTGEHSDVSAAYRLVGWERGSPAMQVVPFADEMPPLGPRPASEEAIEAWKRAGAKIEREYHAARRKAVSATRVNVSLAVRNGFEAVLQHRLPSNPD